MKILAAVPALLLLAACGSASDQLAQNVEDTAEAKAEAMRNRAEMLQAEANNLTATAERVETSGEARADAIRAADQNVSAMTPEQRQAIVQNEAAAVR